MSENQNWLGRVGQYIKDAVVVHEIDLQAKQTANRFIKWWLEQIRNLLAVTAFYFLAQRSDSLVLKALAEVTFFLFFAYFATWQNTFSIRFFPYIKNQNANFWINLCLWMAVFLPIWLIVITALSKTFDALSKIPAK